MYFEVLGKGDPVLCMGGWGTYCHGNHGNLARGLTDKYQVIIFDYRGIGDSGDDPTLPATIELHANDAIALLAGFWTPIGGVLQALVEFANVLAGAGYEHVVRADWTERSHARTGRVVSGCAAVRPQADRCDGAEGLEPISKSLGRRRRTPPRSRQKPRFLLAAKDPGSARTFSRQLKDSECNL